MWHHCLSPSYLCGGGELRSSAKCPLRAKTFTHPSPHRSLPGALRKLSWSSLCSYPEHKGLSLGIPYQTACFLKHNYFQGPAEEEGSAGHGPSWALVMQQPTAQGSSSLLPHAWPDTSLCCSFPAWHPHAEHTELAVLSLFASLFIFNDDICSQTLKAFCCSAASKLRLVYVLGFLK